MRKLPLPSPFSKDLVQKSEPKELSGFFPLPSVLPVATTIFEKANDARVSREANFNHHQSECLFASGDDNASQQSIIS
jgi:hypothetical protein